MELNTELFGFHLFTICELLQSNTRSYHKVSSHPPGFNESYRRSASSESCWCKHTFHNIIWLDLFTPFLSPSTRRCWICTHETASKKAIFRNERSWAEVCELANGNKFVRKFISFSCKACEFEKQMEKGEKQEEKTQWWWCVAKCREIKRERTARLDLWVSSCLRLTMIMRTSHPFPALSTRLESIANLSSAEMTESWLCLRWN